MAPSTAPARAPAPAPGLAAELVPLLRERPRRVWELAEATGAQTVDVERALHLLAKHGAVETAWLGSPPVKHWRALEIT
jgi:hypothetical protein